jgi:T4 superinfection immunity protein
MNVPRYLVTKVLVGIMAALTALFTLGVIAEVSQGKDPGNVPLLLTMLWAVVAVYFAPTLIADWRGKHNVVPIFLINLLFGWFLGIGWIVALIWSLTYDAPALVAPPPMQMTVNTAQPIAEPPAASSPPIPAHA